MKNFCFKLFCSLATFVFILSSPLSNAREFKSTPKTRELIKEAKDAYLKNNYLTAKKHYERACRLGDMLGCSGVGTLFERGLGVLQDFTKAAQYYQYACKNGDTFGCFHLHMLESGPNTIEYYSKACDDENKEACLILANRYYQGMGIQKDADSATNYYQKACVLKSPEGCFNLGILYQNGEGKVKQNSETALAYFYLARQYFENECQNKKQSSCEILRNFDSLGFFE